MSGKFMMNGIEYLGGGSGGGGGNVDDVYVNGESVLDENKIAQVTSYKEVTLAEYMALPDTKLTDGVMYCIKDVGGANQFPPLIYSDEEREVGVWRDGKPLYQKTFSTNITSATQWIMTGLTNVERVITSEGSMINSNNEPRTLPSADSSSIAGINTFMFSNGELACLFRTSNPDMRGDLKVTLRYTKTTDTAGSGTWTTDGTYAKHYSTSEKVVGTWIDGKPLYEKTLITDSISLNIVDVNLSALSIDLIANFQGVWKRNLSSSTRQYPLMPRTETPAINSYGITYWYEDDTKNLEYSITGYSISEIVNIVMVLQYTKTTD